jgi:hypothetical protein
LKRANFLILQARRMTNNETFSSEEGIGNEELLAYLNNGQDRLFRRIVAVHPKLFIKEKTISAVMNQESYNLPDDVLHWNAITSIEYSYTGLDRDYSPLRKGTITDRSPDSEGVPSRYIMRSGKFLASPIPNNSAGSFRVSYVRRIQKLDLRRGRVLTVTLDTTNKQVTALTLDVGQIDYDFEKIQENDYLCVVDRNGEIQMADVLFDSLDEDTGAITVSSDFVYQTGETIAVGDYIVLGKNTSTHSELSDDCDGYLEEYVSKKINHRDSSDDFAVSDKELKGMEDDIVDSFSEVEQDVTFIPEINEDY